MLPDNILPQTAKHSYDEPLMLVHTRWNKTITKYITTITIHTLSPCTEHLLWPKCHSRNWYYEEGNVLVSSGDHNLEGEHAPLDGQKRPHRGDHRWVGPWVGKNFGRWLSREKFITSFILMNVVGHVGIIRSNFKNIWVKEKHWSSRQMLGKITCIKWENSFR